ncbi:hypothetical protein LMG28727_06284 [Paraburkholderia kirstenboschensis]|nr:hypothetical protein LMG28727_06284 [Paraburkholderia kirstenboschensis]
MERIDRPVSSGGTQEAWKHISFVEQSRVTIAAHH